MPRRALLPTCLFLACAQAWAQDRTPEAPLPYEDRVLDPTRLPPLPPDEEEAAAGASGGWPRSLSLEAAWGQARYGQDRYEEAGVLVTGFVATPRYGDFTLSGTFSHDTRRDALANSLTLWQRNFHVGDSTTLDSGLGVLNTAQPDLMRSQYRFFLPSASVRGVQVQATQTTGLQIQATAGQPGVFTGTRLAGFEARGGHVVSVGANQAVGDRWSVAVAAMDARVQTRADDRLDFINGATTAAFAAAAWQGPQDRVQFNALTSRADGQRAQGGWIDASSDRGRYTHRYGVFYLEPDLSWSLAPINNDLVGAYYRLAYQYGRWDWNAGADRVRSISGDGLDGTYLNGYVRYQASSGFGWGGSASAIESRGRGATAVSAFADRRSRWGQSRLQLDMANDGSARDQQVSLDHAFSVSAGNRLAANVAFSRTLENDGGSSRQTALSLYGGRQLGSKMSVDGNVRWVYGQGGAAVRGSDANIGLTYQPTPRWSVSANYYRSRGTQRTPFVLDPLIPDPGRTDLPGSSSFYISARYDWSAGRATAVVGGAPGVANGSLRGTLFLDENGNGQREANELPAPNVTVVVDGRFSLRTDAQGRFDIPLIATGSHALTIVPDNLPLPWSFSIPRVQFNVGTRADVVLDIGATRPR